MEISISGHKLKITSALKDYTNNKLAKVKRHSSLVMRTDIVLTIEKERNIAEGTLHIPGADIHASSQNTDMYSAIDDLTSKLDKQLVKYRERSISRMHGC